MPTFSDFVEHVKRYKKEKNESNVLDLASVKPGDNIRIEFYPDPTSSAKDGSILPLTIEVETERKQGKQCKVKLWGGPEDWQGEKAFIEGTALSPLSSSLRAGILESGGYPELVVHDEELAKKQKSELETQGKTETLVGEMSPNGIQILEKAGSNPIGFRRVILPMAADVKLEKRSQQ